MPVLPSFDVRDQVALVTGAARGLGRAIALALAAAGADVALGLRDAARDGGVAAEIEALGRRALPLQMDMARPGQIGQAVDAAAARFGRLDILVNNAGIAPGNPAEDVREEDLDATLAVNLKGTFLASQAAGRVMIRQRHGRIISIGSQAGAVALPGESVYCVYDRLGESWWNEASPLNILHGSVTPGRFAYFRDVLTDRLGTDLAGLRALDIGCGGGFLAEEFAALGCLVTGIDPSAASIGAARAHAAGRGLRVDYRVGTGEELPVPDAAFELAYCCDVLEHVSDLDRVIGETARVLTPGGLYLFDTVNRTLKSKLLAIKLAQQWPLTRLTDVALHDWDMFITPGELAGVLERHGLVLGQVTGLGARARPLTVLRAFAGARLGRISYGEFSRRLDVGQVRGTAVSYIGFAVKAGRPPAGRQQPEGSSGARRDGDAVQVGGEDDVAVEGGGGVAG